jgi:hypothetical protein
MNSRTFAWRRHSTYRSHGFRWSTKRVSGSSLISARNCAKLRAHAKNLLGAARFQSVEPRALEALDGYPQRFEQSMQAADGTHTRLDVHYVPDRDASEVRGFFVLVTDTAISGADALDYVTPEMSP